MSNRRWFQFSLRTLLIVVTLVCVFLGFRRAETVFRLNGVTTQKLKEPSMASFSETPLAEVVTFWHDLHWVDIKADPAAFSAVSQNLRPVVITVDEKGI